MAVYLLHFSEKYRHAGHYIGFANDVEGRINHHRNGTGARLTQVVTDFGIQLQVARIWQDGDRAFERKLKNCKHAARYCPICNPKTRGYTPKESR